MENELKTFDEWKSLGFRVHKGEKAVSFKEGNRFFALRKCIMNVSISTMR